MHAKTKALLVSVLLLPTTVMATDGNAPPQNRQQLQIEQIQDETALYEAMLAREKSVMSCVHWSWGSRRGQRSAGKHFRSHNKYTGITIPRLTEIFGVQPHLSARIELPGETSPM